MNEQQHTELWLAVVKASETCGPNDSAAMCAAIDKLCDALMADAEQYKEDAERFRAIEHDFSVMSLDIDGNHYWVWRGRGYRGANLREAIDKARKSAAVDQSSPGG